MRSPVLNDHVAVCGWVCSAVGRGSVWNVPRQPSCFQPPAPIVRHCAVRPWASNPRSARASQSQPATPVKPATGGAELAGALPLKAAFWAGLIGLTRCQNTPTTTAPTATSAVTVISVGSRTVLRSLAGRSAACSTKARTNWPRRLSSSDARCSTSSARPDVQFSLPQSCCSALGLPVCS